jgi:phospho-N-acetylmuramoyl-pentapeptide-transferase
MELAFFTQIQFISFFVTLILAFVLGIILIPILKRLKFGQTVRDDGPIRHLAKTGTPTIGGLLILIPVTVMSVFLYFSGEYPKILPLLLVTLAFGAIGFLDDMIKIVKKNKNGLSAFQKMVMIVIFSSVFALYMITSMGTDFDIRIFGFDITFGQPWMYVLIIILIFSALTNAVNLTDGLDGLAAGVTLIVMFLFIVISKTRVEWDFIKVFSSSVSGGCLGFLVFNMYPAKIFMGDTGSLALGGAVAGIAVMMNLPMIVFIAGAVYIIEALSVIIQVISFKSTGKRVFKMAPVHHHFELSGWKETKIVYLFWFASIIFCILGYIAFKSGIFY